MGTERTLLYQQDCACGQGSVLIHECSPNHMWGTANPYWHEHRIDCEFCEDVLSIVRRGDAYFLLEKSKGAQRDLLLRLASERGARLLNNRWVAQTLRELESLLSRQKSIEATRQLLNAAGLTDQTENEFRRRWAGASAWIKVHVLWNNLQGVYNATGRKLTPAVMREIQSIEQLVVASKKSIPRDGMKICEWS